jgi:hypothetical protein
VSEHDDAVVAAHDQRSTIHIVAHVPEHAPREDDPHYHLFSQTKARLKRQGLWKCVIGDDLCGGQLELHHSHVEQSQINAVDPRRIEEAFGLHFEDDEAFERWVQSPGNLEVLCVNHHRTHYGVHVIPSALWEMLRWHRAGQPAAAEFVAAKDLDK